MKLFYYLSNVSLLLIPNFIFSKYKIYLEKKYEDQLEDINKRVNYYCKAKKTQNDSTLTTRHNYKMKGKSAYYYDLKKYLYFFDNNKNFKYYFGDTVSTEKYPTIYKARKTSTDYNNSVLFKLDKIRHFKFITDSIPFNQKKNLAIFRGSVTQPHRIRFMEEMFSHPMINAGQTNLSKTHPEWVTSFLSRDEQLKYKFIICLEGNDVASNLKWVMSSNSIAVTPKMHYETWFMEGALIPGVHYIQVKDDWSDFEEKINYYINHPKAAQTLLNNAHKHVAQFKDNKLEDLVCIKTLEKYFSITSQIN